MQKQFFKKCALTAIMAASVYTLSGGGPIPCLQSNERIVFLGDSITQMGTYIGDLQLFYALRRPGCCPEFINGGILGECVSDGIARLDYDIMSKQPDRIFVMFGMNDVGRDNYRNQPPGDSDLAKRAECLERYQKQLALLADQIKASGKMPVLMTSTPYDQYTPLKSENLPGCNDPGLKQCAQAVKNIAREKQLACIDLHQPMTELLIKSAGKPLCGLDRIHPGPPGHLLIAALILQACGESPEVAAVTVDTEPKTYVCRNAKIGNLQITPEKISFIYEPEALPFPRAVADEIAGIYPFADKLNMETLRITGLADNRYVLRADGQTIGNFSGQEFKHGINLALLATPSQRIAGTAAEITTRLVATENELRYLKLGEKIIRREGGQVEPLQAGFDTLDNYLQKQQGSIWYNFAEKTVNFYKTNKPRQAELTEKDEALRQQLRAVRPSRFTIEIECVK